MPSPCYNRMATTKQFCKFFPGARNIRSMPDTLFQLPDAQGGEDQTSCPGEIPPRRPFSLDPRAGYIRRTATFFLA